MIKTFPQLVSEVKNSINEVTVSDLADVLANEIVLIDVREPAEFSDGHIASAVNFPRGVLEGNLSNHPSVKGAEAPLDELNNKDIYLICRSGARSAMAAESLQKMGFQSVFSVAGGMMEWSKQGLHVE